MSSISPALTGVGRVHQEGDRSRLRPKFAQQLEPLGHQSAGVEAYSGGVAARPIEKSSSFEKEDGGADGPAVC